MRSSPSRRSSDSRRRSTARALDCIRRLINALGESARTVEQRTGLTNAQLFLLRQLLAEDGLSINALAARALTQQSTVSLLVRRLEAAGYVNRTRSQLDARQVVVTITARGRNTARRAPDPPLARMLESLEQISEADVAAISRGLGALLLAMQAPSDSAPLFESRRNGR